MAKLLIKDHFIIEYALGGEITGVAGLNLNDLKGVAASEDIKIDINKHIYSKYSDSETWYLFLAFLNCENNITVGKLILGIIEKDKANIDTKKKYKALKKCQDIASNLVNGSYKTNRKLSIISYATIASMLFITLMVLYLISKHVESGLYHIDQKYFSVEATEDKLWTGFFVLISTLLIFKVWITVVLLVIIITLFLDLFAIDEIGLVPIILEHCKMKSEFWNKINDIICKIGAFLEKALIYITLQIKKLFESAKQKHNVLAIKKARTFCEILLYYLIFEVILFFIKILCITLRRLVIILFLIVINFQRTSFVGLFTYAMPLLIMFILILGMSFSSGYKDYYIKDHKSYCQAVTNKESQDIFIHNVITGEQFIKTESAIFHKLGESSISKIYVLTPGNQKDEKTWCKN